VVDTAELGNLLVAARLLVGELIAGETYDDQSLVLIFFVKGFQTVVLRGESALGGGVDNHKDFSFILLEVHLCALVALGLEIVYLCHIHLKYLNYIVHDANIQQYFYIASDISKKISFLETCDVLRR
jgi:hypothetical protein